MSKTEKKYDFVPRVRFKEQTPEVHIEKKKSESLYERAYLSHEAQTEDEYGRNTTTWD